MKTRLLSMLLSLCMALTMFPAGAFAAQPEQEQLYAQMLELGLVDGDGALIEDNSFTVEDGTRLSSLDELTDWLNQCTADELNTVITVDAHGENTIVYSPGSNAQVTVDYVESVRDALTHPTVLGLCLESPIETVTAAARMCHEAGVKVLLNDSPFTPSLPVELIEASDILLVNEHEMAQLLDIDEPENDDWDSFDWWHALDELRGFGFEQAIVTLGGDGSVVLDGTADDPEHRIQRIAPVRVKAVDTTGCGDSFMGTVLAGLASGMTLSQSAELASYVSAYAATGYGAQASYGTAAQIREAFADAE